MQKIVFGVEEGVNYMPRIRSSTDLRNNYNEISEFCRENHEPVFITKNGQGDLAVMSMEFYEMLNGRHELFRLLDEGRTAVSEGRKRPFSEAIQDIRRENINGQV